MNKKLLCLLVALSFGVVGMAQNKGRTAKLSPLTQQYLHLTNAAANTNEVVIPGYVYKKCYGRTCISAFLKVNNSIDQTKLDALNISVTTKAGNIWVAQIPVENVAVLTKVPGIDYIQLDEPVYPTMDSVRRVTGVDSVQQGIGLTMPYTGKNVVVGIIDAGFDYRHPEFFDTSGKAYRVKRVWEEKTTGTPPAGFSYGNEMTDSTTIWAAGTDNNTLSHGTHVAGIAGGSGFGGDSTNMKYRGIAYQGDVVLVGIFPSPDQWINTGMTDFVDGINYIFKYATSVGKPAVANLSWGASLGPHDGTALFSQACDNLTGKGKIFVCAAGNNGGQHIHLQKKFTATDTTVKTFVTFDPNLGFNKTWIDIWGDTAKSFCVSITLNKGSKDIATTGYICLDDTTHYSYLIGSGGDTCFVTTTTSSAEFNEKPRTYIMIDSKVSDLIYLTIKANDGTVNAWNGYVYNHEGYYGPFVNYLKSWAVNGDDNQTISDLSSTRSAITAAAFASKVNFTNIASGVVSYASYVGVGNIAPFSSKGPTADGRIKPDIAAPGLIVGSGVNSYDTSYLTGGTNYSSIVSVYHNPVNGRNYDYGMLMGTSMASPATAGIVALMLEANPNLTPGDVKKILSETAIQDHFTGVIPAGGNSIWGAGKIDAYTAVKKTIATAEVYNIKANPSGMTLYPNPNNGNFTIDYESSQAGAVKIDVFNLAGKDLFSESWNVNSGHNSKTYNFSGLSKGIYFTRVSSQTGNSIIKTIIE